MQCNSKSVLHTLYADLTHTLNTIILIMSQSQTCLIARNVSGPDMSSLVLGPDLSQSWKCLWAGLVLTCLRAGLVSGPDLSKSLGPEVSCGRTCFTFFGKELFEYHQRLPRRLLISKCFITIMAAKWKKMVFCYHNCSNVLWEKIVLVWGKKWEKSLQIRGHKAENL